MSLAQPEATKDRILAAALAVFSETGVSSTGLREVARRAGVAVGLANYHFGSKEVLLSAVIEASRAYFLGELERRVAPAAGPELLRQLLEVTASLIDLMPNWFRLTWDLDALALRNDKLAAAAASSKSRGQADVRHYLALVLEACEQPAPGDLDALATVLLAAFDGIAVRRLLDPRCDMVPAYLALERMLLRELMPGASAPVRGWNRRPLGPAAPTSKRPTKARARSRTRSSH